MATPVLVRGKPWIKPIFRIMLSSLAVLVVLSLAAVMRLGSVKAGLLAVTGQQLVPEESELSVGTLEVGDQQVVIFHLTNLTDRPITVVGSQSNCTCTSAERLPLMVPARGRSPLRVTYRAQTAADVSETVRLFTDSERNRQIVLRVTGRVVASALGAAARSRAEGPQVDVDKGRRGVRAAGWANNSTDDGRGIPMPAGEAGSQRSLRGSKRPSLTSGHSGGIVPSWLVSVGLSTGGATMRYLVAIGTTLLGTTAVVCMAIGIAAAAAGTASAGAIGACARDVNRDVCEGTCPDLTTCQDGSIPLTCVCK